ncbi:phosphopyruvate hydratase [Candidatus Woesearchaeota archaeon]|nr:phosphopyruvate hydratase [Candidatus Woesearchaeota archaeon]
MKITSVRARQVFDSRGNPTVEAEVTVGGGVASAIVPSGASTGIHEALELRDGGRAYHGKGVLRAVDNANAIGMKLVGRHFSQEEFDSLLLRLDGTQNKYFFGANAILALSMAFCRATASCLNVPLYRHVASLCGKKRVELPVPVMNVINGGKHAGTRLDIQECLVYPKGKHFFDIMRNGVEVYYDLKQALEKRFGKQAVNVGDEGGFVPPFLRIDNALSFLNNVVGSRGRIGIDVASSGFYSNGKYKMEGKSFARNALLSFYENMISKHSIVSVEDPFCEEDFDGFSLLCRRFGNKCLIVGDDLLVTSIDRIKRAIEWGSCNCLLLKLNQVGTVTEAVSAGLLAQRAGWEVMVSHRSGDSEDAFIADFAVGINAKYIKSGAPCRSERVAKYNRLLRIEEEIC